MPLREQPLFAVTNRIPEPAVEMLREAGEVRIDEREEAIPRADLLELVAGADAVLTLLHDRVDEEMLEAAGPGLRCVANVAVGYDNVDVAAATERGVVVTNTPGVLTDSTADLAMALILMVTRRLGEGERLIRSGKPWSWHMFFLLGSSLAGKTLGVIGLVLRLRRLHRLAIRRRPLRQQLVSLGRAPQQLSHADIVRLDSPR